MMAKYRKRLSSLSAGKRWLAFVGGVLVNLAILAVVVFGYLSIFGVVLGATGATADGLLFATYLYWASLLFPTIFYLLILEFAVDGSTLIRRLWAIALSPICVVALFFAAVSGSHESLGRWLLEAFSLPLAYGLVVRLRRYSESPRPQP